jgi:DNA-binding beta-propeller fold protein YncE
MCVIKLGLIFFLRMSDVDFSMRLIAGNGDNGDSEHSIRSAGAMAVDNRNQNLYVTDFVANRIRKIDLRSGKINSVVGLGNPMGICIDQKGDVYCLNTHFVVLHSQFAIELIQIVGNDSSGYVDGEFKQARFDNLRAIQADGQDNLYVTDLGNNLIRKISIGLGMVSTIAGNGGGGHRDGIGRDAMFDKPFGIAIDRQNMDLFVTEMGPHIRRLSKSGTVNGEDIWTVSTIILHGSICDGFWPITLNTERHELYVLQRHRPLAPRSMLRVELHNGNATSRVEFQNGFAPIWMEAADHGVYVSGVVDARHGIYKLNFGFRWNPSRHSSFPEQSRTAIKTILAAHYQWKIRAKGVASTLQTLCHLFKCPKEIILLIFSFLVTCPSN